MATDFKINNNEILRISILAIAFIAASRIGGGILDKLVSAVPLPTNVTYFIILILIVWIFKIA